MIELIENKGINVPESIKESAILTDYSVEMRYPGNYEEIKKREYKNVVKIANNVIKWVCKKVKF